MSKLTTKMKPKLFTTLFTIVLCISQVTSTLNILVLSCQDSRSHLVHLNVLTAALLEKGHHVYELVSEPTPKHPNRTTFAMQDKLEHPVYNNIETTSERTYWESSFRLALFSIRNCKKAFNSQATSELLALARDPCKKTKIDVVVLDFVFGQCLGAFAKEFGNAPIVAVTAFGNPVEIDEVIGAPTFPSFVAHDITTYSRHHTMTWMERLRNKIAYIFSYYYRVNLAETTIDEQLRNFFGANAATMEEINANISVALVNSHPAIQGARPQLPAVVEIGGLHIPPIKEIPKGKLKDFLDSAKDGFILMSFGSVVRSTYLEPWRRKDLMRAFERLKPLRVVMKWEDPWNAIEDGPLPTNVLLSPWLPQSDILGHPNIRLFATHCGLLSTFEIIARAVPMIAIPFFADQFLNAKSLTDMNVGIILPFKELNEESLYNAVNAVLNDTSYAKSVRRLSSIIQDQIETPKDRAVYWVEFVARHGGALHLRSPALRLPWVARWMIDDIVILSVLAYLVVTAVNYLVKLCIQIRITQEKLKEW